MPPQKSRKGTRGVREPLQVYLGRDERAMLDRLAKETGLARAEILRRGILSFAREQAPATSPMLEFLRSIRGDDWPEDIGERHDDYLTEAYLDTHDGCQGCR